MLVADYIHKLYSRPFEKLNDVLEYIIQMLVPKSSASQQVPIFMHYESEQARSWSQVFSEDTKKQSIPVIASWQLNERM